MAGEDAVEGTPFGRYRLIELLGRGGMGEVWRAYDTDTDRVVALKLLPPHLSDDDEFQRRFRREAHAAAQLNDPHVIPIHHYGEIDGRLYVDMRLIEGHDLAAVLADGPLEPERAVRIIAQVAKALHAAHKVGLLHRDIKPHNILLDDDDFAYLIDFGIARAADETRMTKSGFTIGTFQYIAPERLDPQKEDDARADIYSLACVLYESLTGEPPFAGTHAQLMWAHVNTPPPRPSTTRPDVPPKVDEVIATGMAKEPNKRYATTVALADAARNAITIPISRGKPHRILLPRTEPAPPPAAPPTTHPASRPPMGGAGQPPYTDQGAHDTLQRRAEAKRKLERQLERRANQARRWRIVLIAAGCIVAAAVIVVVTIGIVSTKQERDSSTAASTTSASSTVDTTTTASSTAETTVAAPQTATVPPLPAFKPSANVGANCQYPASSDAAAKQVKPPRTGRIPTNPAQVTASMVTNRGHIGLILANNKSPCTVNNFASLIGQRYFDNTACHRLTTTPGLSVLQCGDPKGDGTGGPGYQFANEYPTDQYATNDPKLQEPVVYPRGTLAMANAGPNTNGSQFFMVYGDSELPPEYTVFGTIDPSGLITLDSIADAGVAGGGQDGAPASNVTITSLLLD